MTVQLRLSPREVRRIQEIAPDRQKPKEDIPESRVEGWTHDPEDRHYFSVLSEWAFAKHYNLQIDSEIYRRSDQGRDFRVRIDSEEFDSEIVDVDVKSSPYDDPELLVKVKNVNADYYVLARFPNGVPRDESECVVELVGGVTKERLLNREPRESLYYGHHNYHVQPKYLSDLPPTEAVQPVE
jgi:hypothetical protein